MCMQEKKTPEPTAVDDMVEPTAVDDMAEPTAVDDMAEPTAVDDLASVQAWNLGLTQPSSHGNEARPSLAPMEPRLDPALLSWK